MNVGKRILGGVAIAALWVAACAIVLLPAGCATIDEHESAARLIARGAVVAYIERAPVESRGAVALKVLAVTADVLKVAGNGEPITIQRLASAAAAQLPADMPPGRRVIAMEVISTVADALQKRIGVGGLESDSLVKLADVLGWVDSVATLYAPLGPI